MDIVIIHGIRLWYSPTGTSPALRPLRWQLLRRGFCVHEFDYNTILESFAGIVKRFSIWLKQTVVNRPYIIVAHSMGNLVTQFTLPHLPTMLPYHWLMVTPPNKPPQSAKWVRANPIMRGLLGDCGCKLVDEAFYGNRPSLSKTPFTIIGGTQGIYGRFSPFGNQPNDGLLLLEEIKLPDVDDILLLPYNHFQIIGSGL